MGEYKFTHEQLEGWYPFTGDAYLAATAEMKSPVIFELCVPADVLIPGSSSWAFTGTPQAKVYQGLHEILGHIVDAIAAPPKGGARKIPAPVCTVEKVLADASQADNETAEFVAIRERVIFDNWAPKLPGQDDEKKNAEAELAAEQDEYADDENGEGGGGGGFRRKPWKPQEGFGDNTRFKSQRPPSASGRIGRLLWRHLHYEEHKMRQLYAERKRKRKSPDGDTEPLDYNTTNDLRTLLKACADYTMSSCDYESVSRLALDDPKNPMSLMAVLCPVMSVTRLNDACSIQSTVSRYNNDPLRDNNWSVGTLQFPIPQLVHRVRPETLGLAKGSTFVWPFVPVAKLLEREVEEAVRIAAKGCSLRMMYIAHARYQNSRRGGMAPDSFLLEAQDRKAKSLSNVALRPGEAPSDEVQAILDNYKDFVRTRELSKSRRVHLAASSFTFRTLGVYHNNLRVKINSEVAERIARLRKSHAEILDMESKAADDAAAVARGEVLSQSLPSNGDVKFNRSAREAQLEKKLRVEEVACRSKMQAAFKKEAWARHLNLWRDGKARSASLLAVVAWGKRYLDNKDNDKRTFTFPCARSYANLGTFASMIAHILMEFELCYKLTNTHMTLLQMLTASLTVYCEGKMNVHTALWGAHQVGKSFLLDMAQALLIEGSTLKLNYSSFRAAAVDGIHDDEIQIYEDAESSQLGLKGTGKGGDDREAALKSELTGNSQSSRTLTIVDGVRSQTITKSQNSHVKMAATNANLSKDMSDANRSRWFATEFLGGASTNSDLLRKSSRRPNEVDFQQWGKVIEDRWHRDQYFVAFMSKAVLDGVWEYDSSALDAIVLNTLIEFDRRGGGHSFEIRNKKRVELVAFVLTALNACWRHFDDPHSPHYNKEFNWDNVPDMERYLVCTKEIAVFAMTLLASQYEDPLMYETLQSLSCQIFKTVKADGSPTLKKLSHCYPMNKDGSRDSNFVQTSLPLLDKDHPWHSADEFQQLVNIVYGGLPQSTRLLNDKNRIAYLLRGLQNKPYSPTKHQKDETRFLRILRKPSCIAQGERDAEGKIVKEPTFEMRDHYRVPSILLQHNYPHPIEAAMLHVLQTSDLETQTIVVGSAMEGYPYLPRTVTLQSPAEDERQRLRMEMGKVLATDVLTDEESERISVAVAAVKHKSFIVTNPSYLNPGLVDLLVKNRAEDPRIPDYEKLFEKEEMERVDGDIDSYFVKHHYEHLAVMFAEADCPTEALIVKRNELENAGGELCMYPASITDVLKKQKAGRKRRLDTHATSRRQKQRMPAAAAVAAEAAAAAGEDDDPPLNLGGSAPLAEAAEQKHSSSSNGSSLTQTQRQQMAIDDEESEEMIRREEENAIISDDSMEDSQVPLAKPSIFDDQGAQSAIRESLHRALMPTLDIDPRLAPPPRSLVSWEGFQSVPRDPERVYALERAAILTEGMRDTDSKDSGAGAGVVVTASSAPLTAADLRMLPTDAELEVVQDDADDAAEAAAFQTAESGGAAAARAAEPSFAQQLAALTVDQSIAFAEARGADGVPRASIRDVLEAERLLAALQS